TGTWSKQDDPNAPDESPEKEEGLLDKVPNQRIVPFVEDHRNLLILAPAQALSLEAMATLQAALKRGIEMTFQIEEAELVAEPLPKSDERRALMFYEAAEGGAGVLTRLVSEPASLREVASAALQIMHYGKPEGGPWQFEALEATDKHICEAGCYQCLLSYFNQPDHENINRRNTDALKLLVALANAEVHLTPSIAAPAVSSSLPHASGQSLAAQWLQAVTQGGFRLPDATDVPVQQGAAIATAQYVAARALVFLTPISPDLHRVLGDKGWQVLDFADPAHWSIQFAAYPEIFGLPENIQ
ncbi:DUF1998 domain-containing protein, partial [Acidithiobacillus ferridurans]|nr:DUF1998 domain-containing protein [Acidithiobacillus ferridurans]